MKTITVSDAQGKTLSTIYDDCPREVADLLQRHCPGALYWPNALRLVIPSNGGITTVSEDTVSGKASYTVQQ